LAYVFLHLLPDIAKGQDVLIVEYSDGVFFGFGIYSLALGGLLAFYIMERLAQGRGKDSTAGNNKTREAPTIFALHMFSYTVYSLIIGYLLVHQPEPGPTEARSQIGTITFGVAMALHFLVSDAGLAHHFPKLWHKMGRWILGSAVLIGYGLGYFFDWSEVILASITAILGGGIILNVLKEELPQERQSQLFPLLFGAAALMGVLALENLFGV
jgi:hypothetical protein